jgi:hypothetical protein
MLSFADPGGMVKQNLVCGNAVWCSGSGPNPKTSKPKPEDEERRKTQTIRIKLRDGRIGDSTHDVYLFLECRWQTYFSEEFLNNLFGHCLIFQKRGRTESDMEQPYDP